MNHRKVRGRVHEVDDMLVLATLRTRIFKGLDALDGDLGEHAALLVVDPELEAAAEAAVPCLDDALLELWAARDQETDVHTALAEWKAEPKIIEAA